MEESEELVDDEKRGDDLDRKAVVAGLTCLAAITATWRARAKMVRLGGVPVSARARGRRGRG
ncbi:unnamed protein product [Miscanthus lutarioriparius]|uniref:Uncharacterized protein n=1 Tax=Miscanthus lutarioriparius TaxID=422564 RepID=A0A811MQD3_9POAL|nr:unnamed protein product [Miscanthus lutarioriparius]